MLIWEGRIRKGANKVKTGGRVMTVASFLECFHPGLSQGEPSIDQRIFRAECLVVGFAFA